MAIAETVNDSASEAPAMTPEVAAKVAVGREKKDAGDQAFKAGNTRAALLAYHEALMYITGLNSTPGSVMGPSPTEAAGQAKPKTEADEMSEKIYANMSACHLKNKNWKRAVETADKALAKNADNYKAVFRKGKALGELGFFEKCETLLEELKVKNPSDAPTIEKELTRLRAIDNEREKAHRQKLRGWLNREKKPAGSEEPTLSVPQAVASASIEEIP